MNKTVKPEAVSFPVPVEGMSCASCVSSVEKAVSRVPGVDKVSVNLATERADVTFKGTPDLPAVIEAIRKAGSMFQRARSILRLKA
ncbi:heavy-metal-associated domain-containing protein [Brucella suis bv. 1]|nr:heavy-metal-associated domain-containing protein [Brucella suis bv. 1]